MVLADWQVGEVFLSFLWFFLFFIWIWLLITVFADIFRDHEMSGWSKAAWVIFVIILPYLGVFVYLIARGGGMAKRAMKQQEHAQQQFDSYVKSVAGSRRRRDVDRRRAGPPRRPQEQGRHQRRRVRAAEGQGHRLTTRQRPPATDASSSAVRRADVLAVVVETHRRRGEVGRAGVRERGEPGAHLVLGADDRDVGGGRRRCGRGCAGRWGSPRRC